MFASRMAELRHSRMRQGSVAEWLRRWTRNPSGSACRDSNPAAVARDLFVWYGAGLWFEGIYSTT